MNGFKPVIDGVLTLTAEWEPKLLGLTKDIITNRRNSQNRTIKQIIGHMTDSATNNTHRVVHLQYQKSPLQYPNYATDGNNDRWITIQNYQNEDWENLVQLWKYSNVHYVHVVTQVDRTKLNNTWEAGTGKFVSLKEMITDYLRHFKLHLDEIDELINKKVNI